MGVDDVLDLDAVGQAAAVREGRVSVDELVEAARTRIDDRDVDLAAVLHRGHPVPPLRTADDRDGAFHGVPLLVKDLWCDVAGQPSWAGMQLLVERGHRAVHDDASARRLRRAGFVIVGRTTTSELGLSVATEPRAFPPTRNPWDLGRSPGGSSGGSAAAVAAGMAAVAHGNDMAGSLRVPAAWCGLVGLKPTRGRTPPPDELGPDGRLLVQEHVLTRTVRDTGAVLVALGDADRSARRPVGSDTRRPLRIGVTTDVGEGAAVEPAVLEGLDRVATVLDRAGHRVEEARPRALDDPRVRTFQVTMAAAHTDAELRRISTMIGEPVGEAHVELPTWWLATHARTMAEHERRRLRHDALLWARECRSWWRPHPSASPSTSTRAGGFDLLVTPTVAHTAPPIGAVDEPEATRFTFPFNLTGQPALSLPVPGLGRPVGVQLVAAPWRDDLLLHVASLLEARFAEDEWMRQVRDLPVPSRPQEAHGRS